MAVSRFRRWIQGVKLRRKPFPPHSAAAIIEAESQKGRETGWYRSPKRKMVNASLKQTESAVRFRNPLPDEQSGGHTHLLSRFFGVSDHERSQMSMNDLLAIFESFRINGMRKHHVGIIRTPLFSRRRLIGRISIRMNDNLARMIREEDPSFLKVESDVQKLVNEAPFHSPDVTSLPAKTIMVKLRHMGLAIRRFPMPGYKWHNKKLVKTNAEK